MDGVREGVEKVLEGMQTERDHARSTGGAYEVAGSEVRVITQWATGLNPICL